MDVYILRYRRPASDSTALTISLDTGGIGDGDIWLTPDEARALIRDLTQALATLPSVPVSGPVEAIPVEAEDDTDTRAAFREAWADAMEGRTSGWDEFLSSLDEDNKEEQGGR